ncbi:MAG: hypothetical protein COB84_04310 [Rhodobacteraceae bacterium]|nr:MAG: hypothetical protein COB84_04310 [Paracoccaceae bacterium]
MNITFQVIIAFTSVAVLLGLMAVVRRIAQTIGINAEVQRKLVHIGTGLYALTLPWLFPDRWPVYMLIAITLVMMLFLRLPKVAKSGLGSTLHGVDRKSYGDILLALSVGLCFFLSDGRTYLYVLPIAVLTLADAAAALTGSAYGTRFFQVEDGHKSIEGCAVFFVVTLLVSILCLMLLTSFAPLNIIVISLMVAGFGTLVEAASWRGFDNLFLPMGLLVFLAIYADKDLTSLIILAVFFAVTLLVFRFLAPKIGLTSHASRVYITTVFLLFAVTAFQNAIIPTLVLVAHAWCGRTNPCKGRFPDLDVIAALVLVSLGWLVLGNATGWNAVSFYGVTAIGMTMGLSALALAPLAGVNRMIAMVALAVGLCAIRIWVVYANPDYANWAGSLWGVIIATLFLTALTPVVFPNAFWRARITKLTILSVVLPFGFYVFSIDVIGLLR